FQKTLGEIGLPRTLANFLPRCRNRPRNVVVAHLPTVITRRGAPVHQRAQEIDYGAIVHAARDKFPCEIAQCIVQLVAVHDVVDEATPICWIVTVGLACFSGMGPRKPIAEVLHQQRYCVRDELLGLVLAYIGELLMLDRGWLAAKPYVGFPGFWMYAEDNNLLSVRQ